ncbi:delta-aminolevulinic acid dehydratase [Bathycoccus prasinos]|uniref:Delta-aminolevulinic acid dehydratase n=1 Tax=Bathycoccus prasinos TaxID=41875 RepID=K8E8N9_9CHLO|nr:delta-aminolevulinic acid dehydratase [Bathycoccus prasinos]CCO13997.1 delta-aminolevulinic acid dehydratase [Bathycoccus prasinos]|eukprot:XP_007515118.1 delta-aminolevulinic acid dehydratase [Bathycoccus prasinos]
MSFSSVSSATTTATTTSSSSLSSKRSAKMMMMMKKKQSSSKTMITTITRAAADRPETTRVPPTNPEGMPVVPPQDLASRPRRNRRSQTVRKAFQETILTPDNFIYPIFVHDEGDENIPIGSMPGQDRLSFKTGMIKKVAEARAAGVNQVVVFPKTPDRLKTPCGKEAFNPQGLAQRSISLLKDTFPDLEVYTDVALDPYNTLGHDGMVRSDGVILNDETVYYLCQQAVSQARAGADVISPSDMMDGRVGAIRQALDDEGFTHVSIMSYTAKYNSAYYGPFREALDSAPPPGSEGWKIPKDKAEYQMDPANVRECLRESALDEAEGADIMMVKPAGAYLDIIKMLKDNTTLPISAYQVSGEYSMLKAAAAAGYLNERAAVLESLMAIKRAGADLTLTYYAIDAARWLQDS